jgi:hypothetical protein
MTKPIAIFFHCLTHMGTPPELLPNAVNIIREQMDALTESGLLYECSEFIVGINGGAESQQVANLIIPSKARIVLHGLDSRNENSTICALHEFAKGNPDYYILYFHSKGASRAEQTEHGVNWRNCMMKHVIENWRQCVADLDAGFESVGCHWMTGQADGTQNIWAGNFWWARASYLRMLPSMMHRSRIKLSGIKSLESRYESEVWIGFGDRLPRIKDYHHGWKPPSLTH